MAVLVRYNCLHISLPSSAKQQREMTNSALSRGRELRQFSSVQFLLFALINHDYNNYNNNYAFGRQSRKLFCLFKGLP